MAKSNTVAKTGNEAMAEAMRQINPDVVAAYPITPATEIVQIFAGYVADGLVDTEFVPVESEHSAMSACIGASAAGGRTIENTGRPFSTSARGVADWAGMTPAAPTKMAATDNAARTERAIRTARIRTLKQTSPQAASPR